MIIGYGVDLFRRFFSLGLQKNGMALGLASSFIAILIISFGHFPFHVARIAGPFIVIMALFESTIFRAEDVT